MSQPTTYYLESSDNVLREIKSLALPDVSMSELSPATSAVSAMDSPISGDEIIQVIQVMTVIFKSGAAAIAFGKAVKGVLEKHPKASITVREPSSPDKKEEMTSESSEKEIQRLLKP